MNKKLKLRASNFAQWSQVPNARELESGEWVSWGAGDDFADFLFDTYKKSPTFHSLVDGISLYVGALKDAADRDGEKYTAIAAQMALYGGAVIKTGSECPAKFTVIDARNVRLNESRTRAYIRERRNGVLLNTGVEYEVVAGDAKYGDMADKVLLISFPMFQVYPEAPISAAIKAAVAEGMLADYHLTALNHGFTGSLLVNFNGGNTSEEEKATVERLFLEKFSGAENAGAVLFSWNENKDTATQIEPVAIADYGDRYKALSETIKQQIFTAFRVNPNIFGIPTEGTGFAGEEYEKSFKLFLSNIILPTQAKIKAVMQNLFLKPEFKEYEL